ncbi:MAG: EAL domain-containing protein [Pyrinomonadaceae bacterium]
MEKTYDSARLPGGALASQSADSKILDAIHEAVLVVDRDTTIGQVNRATTRLTGFGVDELVGRSLDVLSPKPRAFRRLLDRLYLQSDGGKRLESVCKRKDGSSFPISLSISKLQDQTDTAAKLVILAQDITARKRLEMESHLISRILHGVNSTANLDELLVLIHRSIGRIVNAENFYVALFDPQTELLTMQFFVDKYDPPPPPLKVGGGLTAYVFRQQTPMLLRSSDVEELINAGEVESVGSDAALWLGVPLQTPRGVIGVMVVQDYENDAAYDQQDLEFLTSVGGQVALAIERKQADDKLRKSQERFDLVTRATSDAIWDWNLLTDKLWWNEGFQKLFGYLPEEVGDDIEYWKLRVHPDDVDRVTSDLQSHIDGGKTHWTCEYRFRRRDGSYASVIDRGYVVYDENHAPVRMLGSMMDLSERKSLEDQLTHQALHDPLTKIANRLLFRDRVDHALSKLQRTKSTLAVLFLDLDNFKAINDSLGHAAGDKLLISVAQRLQDCLRHTDTAARLGGDEFAVLLEAMHHPDEAVMIAERIKNVIRQSFSIEGKEISVGTSIGIAYSSEAIQAEELLRNADLAMYRAKSQGKGHFVVFEPQMHDALMERMELESDLRRAVENDEFVLHYQPIVDLYSEDPLGVEALVRWEHPTYGLLPPMKFIPIAEETGLIVPLGAWVLRQACKQVQSWRTGRERPLNISVTVNISIRQFQQKELVEIVALALEESGLPAESLILEITESFMLQDTEATIVKLKELKRLGVRLAIDDFGTGYSSLSYLQRFPVDILKIDKSFIEKIGRDNEGRAVARAIIMMGDSLNLRTIAEGIETPEQIRELQNLGCDAGQGFHFAKPLTLEEMDVFFDSVGSNTLVAR